MKKQLKSEGEANDTIWTIDASMEDGRVKADVMAASKFDGTVELQLTIDGTAVHVRILEGIVAELLTGMGASRGSSKIGDYRVKKGLPNAYLPWSEAEEAVLLQQWDAGDTVDQIAERLGRGKGGVRSRLVKLGRIEQVS